MLQDEVSRELASRLNRIKGQIEGVQTMIAEDRYCIDILNQVNAVRRALEKVALKVMGSHMESCVSEAIRSRNGQKKIKELMDAIDHFVR